MAFDNNIEFRKNPPSPVRDTVHNYIRTTKLETHVIDSPEFQRLRDILQNSTAYLTFPCNTNTRFAHSLGVMHVAGKMFITALKNAHPKVLQNFLNDASNLIACHAKIHNRTTHKQKIQTYEEQWKRDLGNISRFSHNPELFNSIEVRKKGDDFFDPYFVINTMWQIIRLGALTHDFGHLPMSHVFERALESTIFELREREEDSAHNTPTLFEVCINDKQKSFQQSGDQSYPEFNGHYFKDLYSGEYADCVERKFHEKLGLHIFCSMYKGRYDEYSELIKEVTIRVLASQPHSKFIERDGEPNGQSARLSLYSFLHSFFDNDFIDADRIDYCLRDPLSSGSELGAFDSERVISSCTMVKDDNVYRLAHSYKSIGAIESFFFQRHSTYTGIIYHHSILRMNALIGHILKKLIFYFDNYHAHTHDAIVTTLAQFELFKVVDDGYDFMPDENISIYDESWLKVMLRSVQKSSQGAQKCANETEARTINVLINTFLERKVDNLVSIWKSSKDCQNQLALDLSQFKKFNELIKTGRGYSEYKALLAELNTYFNNEGIIFLAEKIKLPRFAKSPLFVDREGQIDGVDSIVLHSLSDMSDSMPTINFFLAGDNLKSNTNLPSYTDKIVTVFSAFVQSIMKESVDK